MGIVDIIAYLIIILSGGLLLRSILWKDENYLKEDIEDTYDEDECMHECLLISHVKEDISTYRCDDCDEFEITVREQ